MPPRKVKWEEMHPDELLDAIATHPACYMAYGLAEPHGAYNALGLDWLKAYALCARAAATHGGVVAPPFCWHIQEQPHFNWLGRNGITQPLCSSLPGDLFLHVMLHQIRAIDARGFHVALLITGHYGGIERDMRLLCEYYTRRSGSPLQIHCTADWECIHFEEYRGDHAGMCETQQLMALRPELVDLTREEPSPTSGPWAGRTFPGEDGRIPTAEIGEKIVSSQIEALGHVQQELLGAYRSDPSWRAPDQARVEAIWHRFQRLTRKYWVASCSWEEYRTGGAPEFPGWEALGE